MNFNKIKKLKHLDFLIHAESTGSTTDLANKLNISVRCVYYYIELLKELGAKIRFNRIINSYVYTSDERLVIGYFKKYE